MKFGIMFSFGRPPGFEMTEQETYRELKELVPLIEELGYHSFHVTEHHFQFNGWCPSPLVALATAAGLSDELRLATNCLLVPLYNPVRLAEDVATLDNLSNGRVTLAVAPGYVSEEFGGYGIAYEKRMRVFEEALDLLVAAWTKETFSFDGEFFHVPESALVPRPVQQPHPPLWYGVSGPRNLARAARRRCTLVASPRHTIRELQEHFAAYERAAAELGFTPSERPVIREVFLADTTEQAEELAGPALQDMFDLYVKKSASGERALTTDDGKPITDAAQGAFELFKSRFIVGDPEVAAREIEKIDEALRPTELICRMQQPLILTKHLRRSIELFAKEVMPAFARDRVATG